MTDHPMSYQIWSEGYRITGNSGTAQLMGEAAGASFADACKSLLGDSEYFDADRLTYWACRLYDNEEDARRAYG